jgi:hypothetical protein
MQVVTCGGCGQAILHGQPAVRRGAVTMHRSCAWQTVLAKARGEIDRLKNDLRNANAEVIASRNEALEFRRQRDAAFDDTRKTRTQHNAYVAWSELEVAKLRMEKIALENERWQLTQEIARATNPLNIAPVQRATTTLTLPVAPPPPTPPAVEETRDERDATEIRFSLLDLD